ncbi:hypothetical protein [Bacillus cereus]|uniref:hypothetical protein n=1 Tax=Bacillus cereus TaxID=1396 RepID=UPI003D018976
MKKTFAEICREEKINIPTTLVGAKRIQRFLPTRSVDFELDKISIVLLETNLPFKCTYTLLKKIAENLIISNREKHRRTDITRLNLMQLPYYHYKDDSFYYSVE